MLCPSSYAVLGKHEIDRGWLDAIDLVLRFDEDGDEDVLFGMRTHGYVSRMRSTDEELWDGYRPLPITLDLAARRFWDFSQVLWLGPDPWPCLAWSNADGISEQAIQTTFGDTSSNNLLAGPEGRGLPSPSQLGLDLPSQLLWNPIATRAET